MLHNTQKRAGQKASTDVQKASLMSEERALFVDEIGYIDQYGSYIESFWEKGVVYFVRDYYYNEVLRLVDTTDVRPLVLRLNRLNSDIREWENGIRE